MKIELFDTFNGTRISSHNTLEARPWSARILRIHN